MSKILVLGATGFAGKNVVKALERNKSNFVGCSLSSGCDLRDIAQAEQLVKESGPDIIINCAAHVGSLNYVTEKAATVVLDNSRMLLNLYEAVAKYSPKTLIVNPIANCAYPANAETFREDQWMNGHLHRSVLSYGSTRRLLWHIGESFYMQHQVRSIYLFVPNMYGPEDSTDPNKAHALNALIAKFVRAKGEGKKEIEVWGTGIAIREWLYAEDFAQLIMQIINNPNMTGLSQPVNIAQNFGLSVRELVEIINGHFKNEFTIRWNHQMPDGAPKKVMDDTQFKKVFRDFQFTDFQKGVERTIKYYQSIYPY